MQLRDMGAENLQDFERMVRRSGGAPLPRSGPAVDKRQTQLPVSISLPALPIPGLPIPLTIDLPGISTVGTKIIPDSAHPFKAPTATDQRGGCPGESSFFLTVCRAHHTDSDSINRLEHHGTLFYYALGFLTC